VKFLIAIAFFVVTGVSSFAGTPDELINLFKGADTLKIVFNQKTEIPVAGDEVSLYTGVIYYKRPSKFRWEYTRGADVLIVSDGKLLKSSIEGDCQVEELKGEPLFPLIELIDSPERFKKDFKVKKIQKEGEWVAITIIPRYKDAFFKEITFILKGGRLKEVRTLQEDGTLATYQIEEIDKNIPLKESLFRVTPCR